MTYLSRILTHTYVYYFNRLSFFLEDDELLADIGRKYGSGEMLTGEIKKILIGVLTVRSNLFFLHFCWFDASCCFSCHREVQGGIWCSDKFYWVLTCFYEWWSGRPWQQLRYVSSARQINSNPPNSIRIDNIAIWPLIVICSLDIFPIFNLNIVITRCHIFHSHWHIRYYNTCHCFSSIRS